MNWGRNGLFAVGVALALATNAPAQQDEDTQDTNSYSAPADAGPQSESGAYSYVREISGEVSLESRWNGRVAASRNLPVSVGDRIEVSSGGRAEIGLADGTALFVGGGTTASFESLRDQQGENAAFSMIHLEAGSLILAARGSDQETIPRIDTDDVTVYLNPGGEARVNYDSNHGTVVVGRAGTSDIRTRSGRYEVRAGEYLMVHGDAEPEVARGSFSRDRFDLWTADRLDSDETRSASARYVDSDRADDVVAMDGYGDWSYNDDYQTDVWSPRVSVGWSPYSNGCWYYTPLGLTWWSSDPWGWYPFHYGSWFFDASWSRWCWAPASVYSPAWVYWGFSGSLVGWCPVGYYSPWFNGYFRRSGFGGAGARGGIYLSLHGTFPARRIDFRGWNFSGTDGFGTRFGRMDVIPGSRLGGRISDTLAISSRPIVISARPGEVRQGIQSFVREAPRVIERTSTGDSERLAPVLSRDKNLPQTTIDAIRGHEVIAGRGRLAGPGAADIAPRGVVVDRTRTLPARGTESGPARVESGRPRATDDWRGGGRAPSGREAPGRVEPRRAPEIRNDAPGGTPRVVPPSDWRGRRSFESSPGSGRPAFRERSADDWRGRSGVPPARRVVEGSVPGRATAEEGGWRRGEPRPRSREADAPRAYRPEAAPPPRNYRPEAAPPPRPEPRRDAPPPHSQPHSAPSHSEHAPAPSHSQHSSSRHGN